MKVEEHNIILWLHVAFGINTYTILICQGVQRNLMSCSFLIWHLSILKLLLANRAVLKIMTKHKKDYLLIGLSVDSIISDSLMIARLARAERDAELDWCTLRIGKLIRINVKWYFVSYKQHFFLISWLQESFVVKNWKRWFK